MTLLKDKSLEDIVNLLENRDTNFYHACQLKDFRTYVSIGGIPSRNLMEQSQLLYTKLDTDAIDHKNGVWSKVFGNLSDFGYGFASGTWREEKAPIPNPYGPILLVASPTILLESLDVAICLRSAGGRHFDRTAESLHTVQEVDKLFWYPMETPEPKRKSFIKFSDELRRDFGDMYVSSDHAPSTYNPEISCTVQTEYLSFEYLSQIIVDKYQINGCSLISKVFQTAFTSGLRVEIAERTYRDGRYMILADLVRILSSDFVPVAQLATIDGLSTLTIDWAQRIVAGRLEWQYNRFANYLREGTLSPAL